MNIPVFVGPADTVRSVNVNAMRTLNFYTEMDQLGKQPMALYGTPGLNRQFTDAAAGEVRGMWRIGLFVYVVCGNKIRKYSTAYSATTLGTLNSSTGQVSMASSETQLMIVDETDGYIVTIATDAFAAISDPDFPTSPTKVAFLDNYFIVNDSGTQKFYISETPNDGTAWDALDFASAEGFPDLLISLIADHRELWLLGADSIEVWQNTGNSDFPFERIQGAFIEQGCAARYSVAKMDNSVFWLGADQRGQGVVLRASGYTPKRISTHAVETAIQGYSTISDAIAFTYQADGHMFYVLTFPTADKTWVYDASIPDPSLAWHERCWRDPDNGNEHRHRSNCYAFFNGKHLVGDWEDGRVYELDADYYSDDGDEILSLRASGHIWDKEEQRQLFHHRLQVDIEAGVGLSTGQGSDPQIMLRWSNDGGHTWSGYHYADIGSFAAIGAVGEYRRRAIWNRLGRARDRVYEVSITDPVKRVIIGANLRATMGNS